MLARRTKLGVLFFVLFLLLSFTPEVTFAYIGPGAGFAVIGSTFVFAMTLVLALLTILFWPIQWLWRKIRGYGIRKNARVKRVVIVGLDGLEPSLVDRYMQAGRLPNLQALSDQGSYSRLKTTLPALSPVAWSTFQTGVNPGAHNIFDFLTRDKRYCLPQLSSTETVMSGKSFHIFGKKISFAKPRITILRKSKPFWSILGKYGIFSNILRVPISYPPERFWGNILSAMSTPDIKGTQGSFTFFSTRKDGSYSKSVGGEVQQVTREGDLVRGYLEGPPDSGSNGKQIFLKAPFTIRISAARDSALLEIGKEKVSLKLNEFSPWVRVEFALSRFRSVSGICRFCVRELDPEFSLYVTPINVDPENPALPISAPIIFSNWIAKGQGPFGTLGLMEDTWGLNEHVLDDQRFLDQTYLTHAEREEMFFQALERSPEGVCACVFDASDRIQHMFWRYLDPAHPAPREGKEFERVIPEMYERMDKLIGRVREKIGPNDVLIVMSDHGFSSFRRCVALNAWLRDQGYLALKNGSSGADYFQDVDWSRTKAYAVGLSGLYINIKGRERHGIVERGEADALKQEIITKLEALRDTEGGEHAVRKVYDTARAYKGLYTDEAPDLVVGYAPGYRVSWDSVTGTVEPEVFSNNLKAWSGDHHIDPEIIPGVLFTSRKLKREAPHIADLAPTVLDLFAVKVPRYMEGQVIL